MCIRDRAGLIQNNIFAGEKPLEFIIGYYVQVSLVLLIMWFFNRFLLRKTSTLSSRTRYLVTVFANVLLVSLLTFLSIYNPNEVLESTQPRMIMAARLGFVILIFNVILRVFESQREKAELAYQNLSLQAENLKFQVDTLKQQINPHFLFNSLNTLLDLVEDKKEGAVEYIRNFSSLYRVVLQSARFDFIPLSDELNFVQQYWALLRVRFGSAIDLTITVSNELKLAMIPPLSLQLLIENAVKHNEATKQQPLHIEVLSEGDVLFVKNTIRPKSYPVASEKVGLRNLQQRYSLLFKPIEWTVDGQYFVVKLPLKIDVK